jgi:hypothetical protein
VVCAVDAEMTVYLCETASNRASSTGRNAVGESEGGRRSQGSLSMGLATVSASLLCVH